MMKIINDAYGTNQGILFKMCTTISQVTQVKHFPHYSMLTPPELMNCCLQRPTEMRDCIHCSIIRALDSWMPYRQTERDECQ